MTTAKEKEVGHASPNTSFDTRITRTAFKCLNLSAKLAARFCYDLGNQTTTSEWKVEHLKALTISDSPHKSAIPASQTPWPQH